MITTMLALALILQVTIYAPAFQIACGAFNTCKPICYYLCAGFWAPARLSAMTSCILDKGAVSANQRRQVAKNIWKQSVVSVTMQNKVMV